MLVRVTIKYMYARKVIFFAPDDRKYAFNVIHFGPTDDPSLYTAMMKDFKDEWDTLFLLHLTEMKTFEKKVIVLLAVSIATIGGKRLIFGSKTVIDDILLWCDVKNLY